MIIAHPTPKLVPHMLYGVLVGQNCVGPRIVMLQNNSWIPILHKWEEIVPYDVYIPYCIKVARNDDQICSLIVHYTRSNHDAATAKTFSFLHATFGKSLVPLPVNSDPTVSKADPEA
jgi:hypothetical protein